MKESVTKIIGAKTNVNSLTKDQLTPKKVPCNLKRVPGKQLFTYGQCASHNQP